MSANDKFGLGYGDHRYDGILSYENEVLQSVFMNKKSEIENQPLYDRFVSAEGMHAVPPPMTGNYMPSGPDVEVDDSKFTYGPKQTQPSESESQSSEFDTCESNISAEPSELVSEPVVNESTVECQSKVWSDAPIIEEYESDSEDEENVKSQFTHSQKPKVDKTKLGHGFTVRACFVCGSLNHLIRDCDFHEKRMARKADLNNVDVPRPHYWDNSIPFLNFKTLMVALLLLEVVKVISLKSYLMKIKNYLKSPDKQYVQFQLENIFLQEDMACLIAKATTDESNKWHRRLGHVNFKNLNKLVKGNLVRGLPSKAYSKYTACVACQKGKQHKASCKAKTVSSISHSLQLLHMDLFGPTSVRSLNHKTYCLVITDDFSRFSWVFFLRTKDETSAILKDFIRQIENQLNQKVKTIRSDNGTEFKNKDVIEFCGLKGIKREYSNARTPQQNRVAERKNRTLIEAARTMLADSFLPNTFWAEAVSTTCYVLNRVLVTKPHNKTPYELLTGQQEANQYAGTEDIIDADDSKKEDESAQDCFVLPIWPSYSSTITPALKTDDKREGPREEEQVFMDELERLKRQEKEANEEAEALRKKFEQETENLVIQEGAAKTSSTNIFSTVSTPAKASSTNLVNTVSIPVSTASPHEGLSLSDPTNPEEDDSEIPPLEDIYQNSTDGIFTTSSYDDEGAVADFTNLETVVNVSPIPTSRIHSSHPSALILGDPTSAVQTRSKVNTSSGAHAFVSYVQKQKRTNHKDFHHCLFACFLSQHEPKKILEALEDESWVDAMQEELLQFEIQKGHRQEEGIDYDEVFAPVARLEAKRIFLDFASYMGFIVYQMDVKSPFLYGKINEENGYRRGTIDKTLFIKKDKHDIILVQVYVDDIIFGSTKKSWCDEFEALMKSKFQMSSMGELTFFLGLQVKQKADGIFISQDKYVAEILKKFDFANVKTASTPIETQKPLVKDEEASDVDVHLYRSMIGSLMYLTASRPDIMFAVCACSRFQVTPKSSHLSAVKRIFRYLKGKPKLGLWYPRVSSFDLESYSDSDYAGANLDRKSTTGGCQFLGRRLISWQCKKQTIVATSTTEAEYVAAASCCGQNPIYHSKTKHIAIQHHFIRDAYEKKLIQVLKIHTDDNVADLLTKAFDVSSSLRNLSQIHSYKQALISLLTTITLSTKMAVLDSCPKHNMVAYLEKSEGNAEFHEIIDFLMRSSIHHALTTDSSPAHTSEVPIEQQTDSSPRPSPSTIIPDSILETSGGNLGGHSSSDKSFSGNEGELTLQSVL
ncbi:putative ribonuclease H-like domain-containing protein [Tanacetum coccineum]